MIGPLTIRRVGIELEGGWDRTPPSVASGAVRFRTDGSVEVGGNVHSGEVASLPLARLNVRPWVEANYPTHVGVSCGLHVHISFGDGSDTTEDRSRDWHGPNVTAMSLLADSVAFWRFLRARLRRWGRAANIRNAAFWDRLGGRNSYCASEWNASALAGSNASRYCAVNFCAYDEHRTVEIRVLPMFRSAALAATAVEQVLDATQEYVRLRAAKRGEDIATGFAVNLDDDAETVVRVVPVDIDATPIVRSLESNT